MLYVATYINLLFQELIKGENDDDDEQDFDSWEPDPVDANPSEFFTQIYCICM